MRIFPILSIWLGALLETRGPGLVYCMPWERGKWAELSSENEGKAVGSFLLSPSGSPRRLQPRGDAKKWWERERNSTHGHPRAWVLSCDLQTEGCSDLQVFLPTLTNMLKWTNPTTGAMCLPNWSCFPDMLYHFPLIGIPEPVRIYKDPETIVKSRDPPGMEATASWTRCPGQGWWLEI